MQRLRVILSLACAIFAFSICIWWAYSYFVAHQFIWGRDFSFRNHALRDYNLSIAASCGTLIITYSSNTGRADQHHPENQGTTEFVHYQNILSTVDVPARYQWWLAFSSDSHPTAEQTFLVQWQAIVPFWLVFVPLATASIPAIRHVIRWLKREPGHCANCGYDLRASFERCPECGVPLAIKKRIRREMSQKPRAKDTAL
jgi:hypothetical protein